MGDSLAKGLGKRSSHDEMRGVRVAAGGFGKRQDHALVAARLVTRGVCVCVCVWCLLELIAKAMTPHPSGSGRCIGYEWALH